MTPPGSDSGVWTPVRRIPARSRVERRPRVPDRVRDRRLAPPPRPLAAGEPSRTSRAISRVLDHALLDRLIRGRIWIAFVAFALIGIVAMQLAQLPLNQKLGRTLNDQQTLTSENSALRLDVSALSSADRIEALASQLGMVPAAPGAIRFLNGASQPSAAAVERGLATPVHQSGTTGASGSPAGG